MRLPVRFAVGIATSLLVGVSAPLGAAVLLPGNILVAGRDQLLLIDPGRRAPEVVSSTSVGGGEPFRSIFDFDLGADGFIYALVDAAIVYRIDPATGDRELVSSSARGAGIGFSHARALEVARDGTIYVGDTGGGASSVRRFLVIEVDPVSGDRTQRFEIQISGTSASVWDLDELDDGRLVIAAGATGETRGIWIADLASGTRSGAFGPFREIPRAVAPQPGTNRVFAIDGVPGLRLVHFNYSPGPVPPRLEVASCESEPATFALAPHDLVLDEDGSLVVSTSGNGGTCVLSGLASLVGRIYRLDPISGNATLLFESEIVHLGAAFNALRLVPTDYPFDDRDGDGLADVIDRCPLHVDPEQRDLDGDGVGDACNDADDRDGDEIADPLDLCPDTVDPLQSDMDDDGVGDACDAFPEDPNNEAAALRVELQACLAELHGDEDADGVEDRADECPATSPGVAVDSAGCSLEQFCAAFATERRYGLESECVWADWRNDEPGRLPFDCRARRRQCIPR